MSAIQSDNPKVRDLESLQFDDDKIIGFSIANFQNKLVILTGGKF